MAFEHAPPSVRATLELRPGQCRAVLDAAPWRCAEARVGEGSWCAAHHALHTRPAEPPRRRSERPSYRR